LTKSSVAAETARVAITSVLAVDRLHELNRNHKDDM